jgi:hypothetical protein
MCLIVSFHASVFSIQFIPLMSIIDQLISEIRSNPSFSQPRNSKKRPSNNLFFLSQS